MAYIVDATNNEKVFTGSFDECLCYLADSQMEHTNKDEYIELDESEETALCIGYENSLT